MVSALVDRLTSNENSKCFLLQLHPLLTSASIRSPQLPGFTEEEHTTDTPQLWLTSLTRISRTWSYLLTSFMVQFGVLQSLEILMASQLGSTPYHLEKALNSSMSMLLLPPPFQSQVTDSPKRKKKCCKLKKKGEQVYFSWTWGGCGCNNCAAYTRIQSRNYLFFFVSYSSTYFTGWW